MHPGSEASLLQNLLCWWKGLFRLQLPTSPQRHADIQPIHAATNDDPGINLPASASRYRLITVLLSHIVGVPARFHKSPSRGSRGEKGRRVLLRPFHREKVFAFAICSAMADGYSQEMKYNYKQKPLPVMTDGCNIKVPQNSKSPRNAIPVRVHNGKKRMHYRSCQNSKAPCHAIPYPQ